MITLHTGRNGCTGDARCDMCLNSLMEFDHVIRVHPGGEISEPQGIYAPEIMLDDEINDDAWRLITGWSGQYMYHGPTMHNSEYVGGDLAQHILNTPGYWVAIESWHSCEECHGGDPDCESCETDGMTGEGWGLAFREAE